MRTLPLWRELARLYLMEYRRFNTIGLMIYLSPSLVGIIKEAKRDDNLWS